MIENRVGSDNSRPIPVIDLFAGPGGLGEGFSRYPLEGLPGYKIALSIEKDAHAHRTLTLRAFYRQFPEGRAPDDYYRYLRGEIERDVLFGRHEGESRAAAREARLLTLGEHPVKSLIGERLEGARRWVLIGGPPCQAYSVVGRARRLGGLTRKEDESEEEFKVRQRNQVDEFESDHRHHLYREYLRIIGDHWPPVFVMENVKGILSSKLDGELIFPKLLEDLRDPSTALNRTESGHHYTIHSLTTQSGDLLLTTRSGDLFRGDIAPADYLIHAERYGIPQSRHRVILVGVRDDIPVRDIPVMRPGEPPRLEDVIGDLPPLLPRLSGKDSRRPVDALRAMRSTSWWAEMERGQGLASVRSRMEKQLAKARSRAPGGGQFIESDSISDNPWFHDVRLGGICNHETRSHMAEDLWRYFFCACFAPEHGDRSPRLKDFPPGLLPDHENVSEAVQGSKFNDRFRVQVASRAATTITSHIAKDGHYFIHYDPRQYRSLTVREAARVQTFPDNYFFEGPRTAQYGQVGNAVPPRLAYQIAEIVKYALDRME